jgi:ribonuclease HI
MKSVSIYADGGARGNPGRSAIGVIILDENEKLLEFYKNFIGKNTNNFAEYSALIKALELAKKHTSNEVHVFMDSELVIRHMKRLYKVKAENLIPLFNKVRELEKYFEKIIYKNVPRENIHMIEADNLVNEALDEK